MRGGFTLSPRARDDLSETWDCTAERWGIDQADRCVRQIVAACTDLAEGRRQGRSIDSIRAGYCRCPVGSHLLFHRQGAIGLTEIVRILHRRRDVGRHL